jgi:hypothetical protein
MSRRSLFLALDFFDEEWTNLYNHDGLKYDGLHNLELIRIIDREELESNDIKNVSKIRVHIITSHK